MSIIVRRAQKADLDVAGSFGAALARAHHEWDPERFFVVDEMEQGYAWWLGKELENKEAVVLVAEKDGALVGYAYGRKEPRDWNSLREECGIAIDLYVVAEHRKTGVGKALGDALVKALGDIGVPFVILQVAANNKNAQEFFAHSGFRPTMIEMTKKTTISR